jgi:hypothetical protein
MMLYQKITAIKSAIFAVFISSVLAIPSGLLVSEYNLSKPSKYKKSAGS